MKQLRKLILLCLNLSFALSQGTIEAPEIVDINISGNHFLSTNELLAQIRLKEKRLFSSGSFYNRHHLAREIQKLENYYTLNGFLDVNISDSLSVTDDNQMYVFIHISEGKEYYLKDITLSGNRVFSDQEYLDLIEYQIGSSFNTFKIRENLIKMLALYRNSGYPLINIQDEHVIDDSVSLFITVKEGPILNIGQINIIEVEHVPNRIIRREIIVETGDLFNQANIEESKRRLYETSLFNSVNISLGNVDTSASTIDLTVEVNPTKFRGFDMNLGLKQGPLDYFPNALSVLSIGLSGSWYHNNIFDSGRRIRIQTKISSVYPAIFTPQEFKLDFFYIEPWLAKLRVPLTINPFYSYWDIDSYGSIFKNDAYGLRAIMTYRWFRKLKIQSVAEWSLSSNPETSIDTLNNQEILDISKLDIYKEARKISLKLVWDERDNFFYPKQGFKLIVEPSMVGYFLGGKYSYMQLQSSFSSYWNIFSNVVFAHNINVAAAILKDPNSDIPYAERFFLGGNSSIRGYKQQMLGPTAILENGESIPTGGNLRYFTNIEIRFPIYSLIGGEVFLDSGNIWKDFTDADFSDIQMAAGLGITIDTPIGPARIDYGIPIGSNAMSQQGQTHIAIAYAF